MTETSPITAQDVLNRHYRARDELYAYVDTLEADAWDNEAMRLYEVVASWMRVEMAVENGTPPIIAIMSRE